MLHSSDGTDSRRNGPSAARLLIATASGSRPQFGQLATGLRRRLLTLHQGPKSTDGPRGDPDLDGLGEPLEETLECLLAGATSPSDLERLKDDALVTGRRPSVDRADVSFTAPSASGETVGGLAERDDL